MRMPAVLFELNTLLMLCVIYFGGIASIKNKMATFYFLATVFFVKFSFFYDTGSEYDWAYPATLEWIRQFV